MCLSPAAGREQLAVVESELNDAVIAQIEVEGVIGFAEHVVTKAARLWTQFGLDQKQQLQSVVFPEGLLFDSEKF